MHSIADTRAFLENIRSSIHETLDPLIAGAQRVALVDFPDYTNVGDSLIWLGQLEALRQAGVPAPAYVTSRDTYQREEMSRILGDGIILIQGGGNLGDLWPAHQHFRERIIQNFPGNRIIQLPQSIEFRSGAERDRARRVFEAHPDFTLLVRTHRAVERAKCFAVPVRLCPDLAFTLDLPRGPAPTRAGAVFLARTDQESAGHSTAGLPSWVERTDWTGAPRGMATTLMNRLRHRPAVWRYLTGGARAALFRALAWQRTRYGIGILSRGRAVVTDRLHGHVLASLLGIPHCVLDNENGKVRALWDTWTKGMPGAVWCDSLEEAITHAESMAGPA